MLIALLTLLIGTSDLFFKEQDFSYALEYAIINDIPVLVKFGTPTCPACVKFDIKIDTDSELKIFLTEDVVFVNVDCTSIVGSNLARKYNIIGYPTFVIINQYDLNVHTAWQGSTNFLNIAKRVIPKDTEENLIAEYISKPTIDEAKRLAEKALTLKMYDEAIKYFTIAKNSGIDLGYTGLRNDPVAIVFAKVTNYASQNPDMINLTQLEDLLRRVVDNTDLILDKAYFTIWFLNSTRIANPVTDHLVSQLSNWMKDPNNNIINRAVEEGGYDVEYATSRWSYTQDLAAFQVLVNANLYEHALKQYTIGFRLDWKTRSVAWNKLAWRAFELQANLEQAEEWAQNGFEIARNDREWMEVIDTLAQIQMSLGKYEIAVETMDFARVVDPNSPYLARQQYKFATTSSCPN